MFFYCSYSKPFWSDIIKWLSLKMYNLPHLHFNDIIYYIGYLDRIRLSFFWVNIIYMVASGKAVPHI